MGAVATSCCKVAHGCHPDPIASASARRPTTICRNKTIPKDNPLYLFVPIPALAPDAPTPRRSALHSAVAGPILGRSRRCRAGPDTLRAAVHYLFMRFGRRPSCCRPEHNYFVEYLAARLHKEQL